MINKLTVKINQGTAIPKSHLGILGKFQLIKSKYQNEPAYEYSINQLS